MSVSTNASLECNRTIISLIIGLNGVFNEYFIHLDTHRYTDDQCTIYNRTILCANFSSLNSKQFIRFTFISRRLYSFAMISCLLLFRIFAKFVQWFVVAVVAIWCLPIDRSQPCGVHHILFIQSWLHSFDTC